MKDFEKKYKIVFRDINIDDNKKRDILNTIYKNNNKHIYRKICMTTIVILVLIGAFFSNTIVNAIKKIYVVNKKDNNKSTCIIPNAIIDIGSDNIFDILKNKARIMQKELEELLDIKVVSGKYFDNNLEIIDLKEENNNLAFARFNRNIINLQDIYKEAYNISTLEISLSFLTNYASEETSALKSAFDEKYIEQPFDGKYANTFEVGNCNDDNMEIYHIDTLNTDLYIYKRELPDKVKYSSDDIQSLMFAFFEYDNILYSLNGYFISENMLKDFVSTLY